MEQYLQNYQKILAIQNFAERTQQVYYEKVAAFLAFCKTRNLDFTQETLRDFLYHLLKEQQVCTSTLKQYLGAVKYFYTKVLSLPYELKNIPFPKREEKLPVTLTFAQVASIIEHASNLKHKTMLELVYSSGLRVSECARVTAQDINRAKMLLRVNQGKGRKDRYTILSHICLKSLEKYWKAYHPAGYLFPGRSGKMSTRAIQHAFAKAKERAGITLPCGIHSLRHSFATHTLETGGGIFQLQKFLGHKFLKTTLVYVHLQEEKIIARSPLDAYAEKQ